MKSVASLTLDTYSYSFMTYGSRRRCSKSRASQSSLETPPSRGGSRSRCGTLRANINETLRAAQIREQGEKEMNDERRSERNVFGTCFAGWGSDAESKAAYVQCGL